MHADDTHAARFREAARNLTALADALARTCPPGFDRLDIAQLFLATTMRCLISELGVSGAADHLRRAADGIEREAAAPN